MSYSLRVVFRWTVSGRIVDASKRREKSERELEESSPRKGLDWVGTSDAVVASATESYCAYL